MEYVVFIALAAIFLTLLSVLFVKKSQLKPPLTKALGSRSPITLYYVTVATGVWVQICKFYRRICTGGRIQENKCEAAGGFLHNEMTLRSMGNEMEEKRIFYTIKTVCT